MFGARVVGDLIPRDAALPELRVDGERHVGNRGVVRKLQLAAGLAPSSCGDPESIVIGVGMQKRLRQARVAVAGPRNPRAKAIVHWARRRRGWSFGIAHSKVQREVTQWSMNSPMGRVLVSFVPENEYGVMDHTVTLPSGESTLNPLREYDSEAKLTDAGEVAPEHPGAKRGPSTLRWWSAELICSLVALASLLAQITVLYIYDGQAQELWPSETFTLNALIAVLATVCRTSFMFTVCSVAAQAKWNRLSGLGGGEYFPLKDYALLDEASRGVWASAQLIWRFKGR